MFPYNKPFSTIPGGSASGNVFPYIQVFSGTLDNVTIGASIPAVSVAVGNISVAGNTITTTLGSLTLDPPVVFLGTGTTETLTLYPPTTPFGFKFQTQFVGVTSNTFTYTIAGALGPAAFSNLTVGTAAPITSSGSTLVLPAKTACYLPTVAYVTHTAGDVYDLDTAVVSTFLTVLGSGNVTGTMQNGPYSGYMKVLTVNSVQTPSNMYVLTFLPGTLLDPGTGATSLSNRTMSLTCGMSVQLTWSAQDACWFICNAGFYLS